MTDFPGKFRRLVMGKQGDKLVALDLAGFVYALNYSTGEWTRIGGDICSCLRWPWRPRRSWASMPRVRSTGWRGSELGPDTANTLGLRPKRKLRENRWALITTVPKAVQLWMFAMIRKKKYKDKISTQNTARCRCRWPLSNSARGPLR